MSRSDPTAERYRRLVDKAGVGLFQTAVDGRVIWVNDATARTVGYESAFGFLSSVRNIIDLYVDPDKRVEFVAAVSEKGSVEGFEYEIRRPDGTTRWIAVTAHPMDAGDELGYEGVVEDITDRKLFEAAAEAISSELEPREAIARFAQVLRRVIPFQQVSLLVVQGDHYQRVVSITAEEGHTPLPLGEKLPLEGNSVSDVVKNAAPVVVQDTSTREWLFDRRLHDAGIGSYAIFPLTHEGAVFATFNVGIAEANALDEDTVGILSALVGATSQAVKNVLAYEQQQEVVRRLEEVDRLRNEFLARVSHDMRNPLTVIAGLADNLYAAWDDFTEERKLQSLRSIGENARRLMVIVRRDLDIALIASGELRFDIKDFDLVTLLEVMQHEFTASGAAQDISLDVPSELRVRGDVSRTRQVLENLLSNAAKFSHARSKIEVGTEARGGMAFTWVRDEGRGINPDDQRKLFQRLSRLSTETEGTGLGLYICRSLVEGQGGEMSLESEVGRGSQFGFTLPLAIA